MTRNTYLMRRIAWYGLWMVALLMVVAACGGSSTPTTTTGTPSPTIASTTTVDTTGTVPSASPTSGTPGLTATSQLSPTATTSQPTPTPTASRPTPTPTPRPTATPTPPPTVVVTIITQSNGKFGFSPQTLTIHVGTTVIWRNTTTAPHTVTGGVLASGTISPGATFSFKFTQAGAFTYHCMFHPYMVASVVVT